MGRPLGRKDSGPRGPHATRGSESSRILARRTAGTCRLDGDTSPLRSPHSLEAFFSEQRLRVERVTNRQVAHVRAIRRELVKQNERASRAEVITGFDVEVRGACGSDVHAREA